MIDFAYDLRAQPARFGVWNGLPKSEREAWYAIQARAEGNPTRDDVRQMVRSLLEDRFQFAGHLEKRKTRVYALIVTKPGPELKPHPAGAPCTLSQADRNKYPHVSPSYEAVPAHCGISIRGLSQTEFRFEMLDVTMEDVTYRVGAGLDRPVIDRTGLTGRYDAVLDLAIDTMDTNPQEENNDSSGEIGLPPFTVALQKQLGLKLVKQDATVDVFVVDHIGKLSEN